MRILLVDDSPDIRRLGHWALTHYGAYEVNVLDSGEAALAQAPEIKPEAILLDVMMPGMGGIKTFEALGVRPETAKIPIIFFTAATPPEEVARYMAMGAAGVVRKPFRPKMLAQEVKDILDFWAKKS